MSKNGRWEHVTDAYDMKDGTERMRRYARKDPRSAYRMRRSFLTKRVRIERIPGHYPKRRR